MKRSITYLLKASNEGISSVDKVSVCCMALRDTRHQEPQARGDMSSPLITPSKEQLLSHALAIEEHGAKESSNLGFMARGLTLCTMPHSRPKSNEFSRKNGDYTLTMVAPSKTGLPYGSIPRLLLAWIATEVVQTKQRTLVLGRSLSQFMRELGLIPSGGAKGDITRLRSQMKRLFSCSVSCQYNGDNRDAGLGFMVVDDYDLWWHPHNPDQSGLWESTLTISEKFYKEILASPIPIDIRALKALKRSPMALDLYLWLTFRNSYLKTSTVITWEQLQLQFGADYKQTRQFKAAFTEALKKVLVVYPAAKIQPADNGILLSPSKTHVPKNGGEGCSPGKLSTKKR